jgi:hypothetical protein
MWACGRPPTRPSSAEPRPVGGLPSAARGCKHSRMAAQGGSSALKNDTWSILLPAIAALVGAIVGAAGSTAATYLTLRENRATEQRKLQADAYVKFIDVANRTHDQLELYEDCTDQCESHEAELLKVEETLDSALDRVFI